MKFGLVRCCRRDTAGAATGRNLFSILCHCVPGKDGKFTGYSGGLDRKGALLEPESDKLALFAFH